MVVPSHHRRLWSQWGAHSISLRGLIPFSQAYWSSTLQALLFANEHFYIFATVITSEMELS